MSVPQRAIVNQRLYFCRLHLDCLEQQLSQQVVPKHVLEQSLGESFLFHLVMTYRAYLAEIAEACSVSSSDLEAGLTSAEHLLDLLRDNKTYCAAAEELSALESTASWLSSLLVAFHLSATGALQTPPVAASTGIAVKQIESDTDTVGLRAGRNLLRLLGELIENQRLQLEEW
jgi:Family of unknown function (DUF6586)